jgi:hypothetical protein
MVCVGGELIYQRKKEKGRRKKEKAGTEPRTGQNAKGQERRIHRKPKSGTG